MEDQTNMADGSRAALIFIYRRSHQFLLESSQAIFGEISFRRKKYRGNVSLQRAQTSNNVVCTLVHVDKSSVC